MATQRVAFHFVDENAADPPFWRRWVTSLPDELRRYERGGKWFDRVEMGERRPLVWVAAPFPDRSKGAETRRDDELESLTALRSLTELLREHCVATGRSVRVLRDARAVGCVVEIGPDESLAAMLAEWQAIDEARPIDELRWWRTDHVSLWAGVVPADRLERLLAEGPDDDDDDDDDVSDDDDAADDDDNTSDGAVDHPPFSDLARALGIHEYDHQNVDSVHVDEPRPLRALVADLRAGQSLIARIQAEALDRQVTAVIALYESDLSNRPHDALGEDLLLVGVFPYEYNAANEGNGDSDSDDDDDDDHFDDIEE